MHRLLRGLVLLTLALSPVSIRFSTADGVWDAAAASIHTPVRDEDDGCDAPFDPIHTIQGMGSASPNVDQVRATQGVVTADYTGDQQLRGFFIQAPYPEWDADPLTSEGIFVYHLAAVQPGQRVSVTGLVQEWYGLTELSQVSSLTVCTDADPIPAPVSLALPFPAAVGGVDYLERYEGMRITLPAGLIVTDLYNLGRGGEFSLSSGERLWQPTQWVAPGAAAVEMQAQNDRNRIVVDDGSIYLEYPQTSLHPAGGLSPSNRVRVGDSTAAVITGVLTYSYSGWYGSPNAYRIHPEAGAAFISRNPRPISRLENGEYLTLASFNTLNYFNGDGAGSGFPTPRGAGSVAEFARQRAKIIAAVLDLDADVIGLVELENDGFGPLSAIHDLTQGLNASAAGSYAFIDPGLAALGGDEITVGIVYRPAVVFPVGAPAVLTTGAFDQALTAGRCRPSLAQTFQERASGARFTVIVNHFKSKSGCPQDGSLNEDQGDGQGCWNAARTAAAGDLVQWISADPTHSGDPDRFLLGDFNAYPHEDPLSVLKASGFTLCDPSAAATYHFDGQAGSLDHILSSASLAGQVVKGYVHPINADEPPAFDYNDDYPAGWYAANAYRSSDHDPLLVQVNLMAGADRFIYLPLIR